MARKDWRHVQCKTLENLYLKYKEYGFYVLGFPCNQFKKKEPGVNHAIHQWYKKTYRITFPLYSKINVNGGDTHPLYNFMKSKKLKLEGRSNVAGNWSKFLINKEGKVLKSFYPNDSLEDIEELIKEEL